MPDIDDKTLSELDEVEIEIAEVIGDRRSDNDIEDAYTNLSFRVVYQSNNFFLPQINDLIKGREVLNLRPEYQRRLRWTTKKKSLLIESLLLNIPVPPLFFFESDLARYEVMDGQQRLNAIHDFLENNFALTGLDSLDFVNGRRYNELPPKIKRGLDRASISAIVLLKETKTDEADPFLVRRYVFERLNTGGENLNPQELRNSLFRGSFNDMIVQLARNDTFCKIFNIPQYSKTDDNEYYENPERQKNTLYRTMNDCQIVLRVFALRDDEFIKGSIRSILDGCMRRHMNIGQQDLDGLRNSFTALIEGCDVIFNGQAFLLPAGERGRQRVSVALYDACMVALYRRIGALPRYIDNRGAIQEGVQALLRDRLELLTGRGNTARAIRDRIDAIGEILDRAA